MCGGDPCVYLPVLQCVSEPVECLDEEVRWDAGSEADAGDSDIPAVFSLHYAVRGPSDREVPQGRRCAADRRERGPVSAAAERGGRREAEAAGGSQAAFGSDIC